MERVLSPFSFHHVFTTPVTAFATDNINDAGKSTILHVLMWALRGTSGLQGDVERWLGDAIVVFKIDSERLLVSWRIDDGRPDGVILALAADTPIDWEVLSTAGKSRASDEIRKRGISTRGADELRSDGIRASAELLSTENPIVSAAAVANGPVVSHQDAVPARGQWPGEATQNDLIAGSAIVLAEFANESEFLAASDQIMMARLGLEPIRLWQKRSGGVDKHDASVAELGWRSLSHALAILDPSGKSVLGEHDRQAGLLLGVFLGSTWGAAATAARWRSKQAEGTLAGLRRRLEDDDRARGADLSALESELEATESDLAALGSVPDFDMVREAIRVANADAIAASRARATMLTLAADYGQAEHALAAAERDLHALREAAVTRRFWHALRPSCCPRCDTEIDESMWARERDGHCSLCDNEIEPGTEVAAEEVAVAVTSDGEDSHDDGEDELSALRL